MDNLLLRRRAIAPKLNISSGQLPLTIKGRRMPLKELNRYGLCEQKPVNYLATVTQTGKCEQNGTPTPSAPVDIVCNNGALKYSANLADVKVDNIRLQYYISDTGTIVADGNNWYYLPFIRVKPNTTYTLSMSTGVYFASISEYSTAEDSGFVRRNGSSIGVGTTTLTITTGATTNYIRFGTNIDRTAVTLAKVLAINWMFNLGDTAMDYQPYVEGGIYTDGTAEVITDALGNTASVVNLLGVGNYADTQEVISGAVVRKVVVKVFDGTENWSRTDIRAALTLPGCKSASYSDSVGITHYLSYPSTTSINSMPDNSCKIKENSGTLLIKDATHNTSLEDWTTFLAQQYAAGTPVIVVYPLATETTESVAGQTLVKAPLTVTAEVSDPTITTTETPVSIPDPVHPLPVWCNNGVLKLSPNLLDPSTSSITIGQYYSANGTLVDGVNNWRTGLIPITGGKTYAFWGRAKADNTISAYNRINWFTANKTHISPRPSYTVDTVTVGTAPSNAAFATLSCSPFNSDDAITREQFDLYNWMFAEASAEIPYVPYGGIYADGTPEVLTVKGKNLYNPASPLVTHAPIGFGSGSAYWPNAEQSTYPNSITYFLRVKPSTTYTYSCATAGDRFGVAAVNSIVDPSDYTTENKLNFDSVLVPLKSSSVGKTYTFTTGANTQMIAVYCALNTAPTNIQIEEGSTATAYEPYHEPQTANVESLLGVGTYKDTQEVVSGLIGGKVRIEVLDGTESWVKTNSGDRFMFYIDETLSDAANVSMSADIILCDIATHIRNAWDSARDKLVQRSNKNFGFMNPTGFTKDSDVTAWTAYLASRYAAGDPVIVVYPLATPTTEQVQGQALYANKGANTVESVNNVSNVEGEVKYWK